MSKTSASWTINLNYIGSLMGAFGVPHQKSKTDVDFMPLKISQSRLNCPTSSMPNQPSIGACMYRQHHPTFRCQAGAVHSRVYISYIYIYKYIYFYINECFHMFRSTYDSKKLFKFKDFKIQGPHEYIYLHSWDFINMLFGAALAPPFCLVFYP